MQMPPEDERCSHPESEPAAAEWVRLSRPTLGPDRTAAIPRLAICALALIGCQTYSKRPLDSADHHEAWHARTLQDGSLEAFLDRLALDPGHSGAGVDTADGLSLHEGQLVALAFNPGLRLARLRVGVAVAGADNAGRLWDPVFGFNATRRTSGGEDPWILQPQLTFSIPLSGRRAAQRGFADAGQHAAEGAVLEAEWDLWHEVERAWIAWSSAGLRVAEAERLFEALDGLALMAPELEQRGEMRTTDAAQIALEHARLRNLLGRLRGDVVAAEQGLRALMGLAPEAPLELSPSLLPTDSGSSPSAGEGARQIEASNPRLERMRRDYEVAEQSLRFQITQQWPDVTLGPLIESDEGVSRLGLTGTAPVSIFNANRQAIAQARARREIARAVVESEYENLVSSWSIVKVRLETLRAQRTDMEQVLVPLADRQLEDAGALMRMGEGTGVDLLESLTRAHEIKVALIEAHAAEALARIDMAQLMGPSTDAWPFGAERQEP